MLFLVLVLLIGCSNYAEENTKKGIITEIEKDRIYIDGDPMNVRDTSDLKVGQKVKVTFIDSTAAEDWDPNDFEVKEIEINDQVPAENKNTSKSPPGLTITIGEETIRTFLGGYSWSYYDENEGSMAAIETETIPPPSLENVDKVTSVNSNSEVVLKFEKAPTDYQVIIWESENNVTGTYDELDISQLKGKVIFRVQGNWEEGKASYFLYLNIH